VVSDAYHEDQRRADLESDALPVGRVHGLDDGHGGLELATAKEKLSVEGDIRWQFWNSSSISVTALECKGNVLSKSHFGGVKGLPRRLIMRLPS
jgi:hypothetical protein